MKPNSFICVVALLSLAGCGDSKPMTNTEIIAQYKVCEDGGLGAYNFRSVLTWRTYAVECMRKK